MRCLTRRFKSFIRRLNIVRRRFRFSPLNPCQHSPLACYVCGRDGHLHVDMRGRCTHPPCCMVMHDACIGLPEGYYEDIPNDRYLCPICKGVADCANVLADNGTEFDITSVEGVFLPGFNIVVRGLD